MLPQSFVHPYRLANSATFRDRSQLYSSDTTIRFPKPVYALYRCLREKIRNFRPGGERHEPLDEGLRRNMDRERRPLMWDRSRDQSCAEHAVRARIRNRPPKPRDLLVREAIDLLKKPDGVRQSLCVATHFDLSTRAVYYDFNSLQVGIGALVIEDLLDIHTPSLEAGSDIRAAHDGVKRHHEL
jgi:hypothetical protein